MRIRSLAAAAAAALFAASGAAWAETNTEAYVGARYIYTDLNTNGAGDDSVDAGQIEGAVSFPVHGNVGAEVESSYAFADSDSGDEDVWTIAGHAFHRTAAGLIGGFLAATTNDDDTAWTVGAEGDAYLANGTVGGQISYTNADDADADIWAAFGHYRFYPKDDWFAQADLGVGNVSVDAPGVDDATFWTIGASTEYRFAQSPFSVDFGVNYLNADDVNVDATAVTVGFRYNFDQGGSLRRRDTHGPSLRARIPALFSGSPSAPATPVSPGVGV
ncbi:MAG: hypothetical protein GC189_00465 [Alphaproteobacteria bacterium]|nr:hypothetical protein [Alphaproteobacteria bacterium]